MKFRLLSAAVIGAVAIAVAPASASASTVTEHDATRDLRHSLNATDGAQPAEKRVYRAKDRRDGDIQWMRLTQGPVNVRLRVHFVELRRIPKVINITVLGFNTAQTGLLITGRNRWQGFDADLGDHLGGGFDNRVSWRFDYESNDLFVTVPKQVFGDRFYGFRAAVQVTTLPPVVSPSSPYRVQYYDNAMTGYQAVPTRRLVFSGPA